jgi:hypothetical protein
VIVGRLRVGGENCDECNNKEAMDQWVPLKANVCVRIARTETFSVCHFPVMLGL